MAVQGGLILRRFLFFALFWPFFFSQNTVFCCPQDIAENVFDLPEEPSHSPVFPKMLCHSSDKYTIWILPFISPSESKLPPLLLHDPLTLPRRFWWSGAWTGWIEMNGWNGWSNFLIGFIQTQECSKCSTFAERIISIIIAKKINKKIPWGLLKPSSRWESIVLFFCFLS